MRPGAGGVRHLVDQFWLLFFNLDGSCMVAARELDALRHRGAEAIRREVGDDFIVGIRMSGAGRRSGRPDRGGQSRDRVGPSGRTGMIDFVNIVKGSIATDEALSHVIPGLGTPLGPGLELAGRFRERLDLPVFHAARIADVATARYAVAEGLVDMVGMMRAPHGGPPHRPQARGGPGGPDPAVRRECPYRLNRIYVGLDGLCIHNVATGREETIPQLTVPSTGPRRTVVVVGAGPAGLETARVTAERGHRVILLEAASDRVGRSPRGARDSSARGSHRHRGLARGRVPARGGRAALRHGG